MTRAPSTRALHRPLAASPDRLDRRTASPRVVAALILLGCGLSASSARAGGFTVTTFGTRRGGMQAVIGCPDDLSAVFHNPAGLADQPDRQVYAFFAPTFVSHSFRVKALDPQRYPEINPSGCGEPGAAPCPWPIDGEGYYAAKISPERYFGLLPYLAASTDLGFLGRRGKDVVVALALYSPNLYGAEMPESAPTAYMIVGGVFLSIAPTLAVGWRVNRYLALGGALSYNYLTLSMSQKLSFADALTPQGSRPEGLAVLAQQLLGDLRMDFSGVDHGVGWNLSALVSPWPWLSIGLGYAGAKSATFEGNVEFKALGKNVKDQETFQRLVTSVGYKLPERLVIEMPIPHNLQAGLHFRLGRRVELGVEARFWLYQLYDKQVLRPIYNPTAVGKEPMTEASLTRDKKYKLSYQVSGGIDVRPFKRLPALDLLAGLGFDASPIPDETFTLDNPSNSYVKVTAGVVYRMSPRWRFSATYLLGLYLPRDVRNSQTRPPTNARGAGITHSPALDVTARF
ncbi:MAG: outer membrane protein transport protein [Deltaproteobacteria bacterium]|nr:outer membrane protein transport protein [Deltaproteobacteria bacterium]